MEKGDWPVEQLKIGVMATLAEEMDGEMQKIRGLGLDNCQMCSWDVTLWNEKIGGAMIEAAQRHEVAVTTFWAGYPGPESWDFVNGPKSIGLVPVEYRAMRVEALKKAASLAKWLGLPSITTHAGFIPENPNDPVFTETLEALREVAGHCAELGIGFWLETGQETPVTMLRTIERLGLPNVGVNFDSANLILYGKANPVDALDVIGKHVRGVHAKDGRYPTTGDSLGEEVPIGQGKVDFPVLIRRLKELGYCGPLTIEREITGEQQMVDIKKAIEYLRPYC